MNKRLTSIVFLVAMLLCGIPSLAQQKAMKSQKETTKVQNNTSKDKIMGKKDLGSLLALYPKPLTVVGAMVNGKPNWLIVGHTGIIGHNRVLVSMSKSHYTNQGIVQSHKLSINLVSREMLPQADYVGSVSGAEVDKSASFAYHMCEGGSPIIDQSPLTMECEVVDTYESEGFDNFICKILHTYADEKVLDGEGKLDYTKLKPVLFEFPTYSYIATGEIIGKCLHLDEAPGMCAKQAMQADGIVRYKENPCLVTILETYASQEAYKQHIASAHFQKYKQGTLHMVKSLQLCDQTPLNPANKLNNYME